MTEKHTASGVFPTFPGEDFLAHAGSQYKEQAEARLAARSLLAVAQGDYPPSVKSIVDVDLSTLPELPYQWSIVTIRADRRHALRSWRRTQPTVRNDTISS